MEFYNELFALFGQVTTISPPFPSFFYPLSVASPVKPYVDHVESFSPHNAMEVRRTRVQIGLVE